MEKSSLQVGRGQSLRLGKYTIKPPLGRYEEPKVWIQHESGEGMDTSIAQLEEAVEESLDMYFMEHM